uniref:Methyltransferase domain-containing protein n=1 Tax=Parascaris equorum TaxID=6256 RepID=A0A914S0I0_PAREQ
MDRDEQLVRPGVNFGDEHERLYAEAKRTSDHSAVTSHYYSVMSALFSIRPHAFFLASIRSVCQEKDPELRFTVVRLAAPPSFSAVDYRRKCVDIGCGIGTVMKDMASTQADLTGVTIAANEASSGNAHFVESGIKNCRIVEGDCHHMPFEESTFDAAYAVSFVYLFRSAVFSLFYLLKETGCNSIS